jgi:hypothetical protein
MTARHLLQISSQTVQESGTVIDDFRFLSLSNLYVERDIEAGLLSRVMKNRGCVVIQGEAGSGKTSLLWHMQQRLRQANPAILLRAEEVTRFEPDEVCGALEALSRDHGKPSLLIDTADAILGTQDRREKLLEVLDRASSLGCSSVVTSRPREAGYYFPSFYTVSITERYSEPEFLKIIQTHVRHFYATGESESFSKQVEELKSITSGGKPVSELITKWQSAGSH